MNVETAVYGESRRRRVGNGKERHPRAIQIEYQKVEETGPAIKRARPECDKK